MDGQDFDPVSVALARAGLTFRHRRLWFLLALLDRFVYSAIRLVPAVAVLAIGWALLGPLSWWVVVVVVAAIVPLGVLRFAISSVQGLLLQEVRDGD